MKQTGTKRSAGGRREKVAPAALAGAKKRDDADGWAVEASDDEHNKTDELVQRVTDQIRREKIEKYGRAKIEKYGPGYTSPSEKLPALPSPIEKAGSPVSRSDVPSPLRQEESTTAFMVKVDAGTQDYSGYFPDKSLATNKFDLVPRVNPELIQRRNESLVQQALKTRVLMAIPRNRIKPKRVPKASFMHVQGGVIKSRQKLRQTQDEDNLFGDNANTGQISGVKGTAPSKKEAVKKKRVPIVIQ